jgi:hypothetical protein
LPRSAKILQRSLWWYVVADPPLPLLLSRVVSPQDNASKEKTMFDVLGEFDVFKRAQVLLPPSRRLPLRHLML